MNRRKRLIRDRQHEALTGEKGAAVPFPLPEGWQEVRTIGRNKRRWNVETGKFDIPA